jgi:MraZ protein
MLASVDEDGDHSDEVVLTHALDGNLDCYPVQRWRAFEERLQELSSFKREVKHVKRLYIGSAQACSIDGNGRLLVPKSMREYANLDREVVWVGVGEKVELWSASDWESASQEALADVDSVGETLTDLGL